MSLTKRTIEWLDKSSLTPHELLSDLAAMNETFLIDGDSLLLEILRYTIIEWNGSSGEYLQVAYLVEAFLNELLLRGAQFKIVFFTLTQATYWRPRPAGNGGSISPQSLLLLRTAVLNHLNLHTGVPVAVFNDWTSAEFNDLLDTLHPSFMLISPCVDYSAGEITTENGFPLELAMAMISLKVFSKSVALAFLSDVHFKDRTIWAESVLPFNSAEHNALNAEVERDLLPILHSVYNTASGTSAYPATINAEFTEMNVSEVVAKSTVITKKVLGGATEVVDSTKASALVSELLQSASFEHADWRYIVTAASAHFYLASSASNADAKTLTQAILLHTVLSNSMAPQLRPRANIDVFNRQPSAFLAALDTFTLFASSITRIAASSSSLSSREWDMADFLDSRLILSILSVLQSDGPISSASTLGFSDKMITDLDALWTVASTGKSTSSGIASFFPFAPASFKVALASSSETKRDNINIIPIRSTMVDRMIEGEVKPELKESQYIQWADEHKDARSRVQSYGWKASRALEYSSILYYDKEYEEKTLHKNRFHAAWALLARSLEARPTQNAVLQPKVLMQSEDSQEVVIERLRAKLELERKPKTTLNDTREKEQARVKTLTNSWRSSAINKRITALASFVPTTSTATFDWLYALLDIHVEQLRTLRVERDAASKLVANPDSIQFVQQRLKSLQRDEIHDQCVSMIVQCVVGLFEYRGTAMLDPQSATMKRMTETLDNLGLSTLHMAPSAEATATYTSQVPATESSLASAVRFQLARMGPWMKRDVGAIKDTRTPYLIDSWQKKVLDCVDNYQSSLVVAPTSAGKSFMAYHAVRRVLEETTDGVLIYVAPTKALVYQVVAEVYSKFSKVPTQAGTLLCGIFLKDTRIAPIAARILVTVPQCLEVLLLSRELAGPGGWRSKLKWVIFDEVHCINMEDGAVWERVLPLVPCPYLALSATVGAIDLFKGWLEKVADSKQEYASERTPLVVADAPAIEPISSATSPNAKATKPIHPKLAAKAAKQQGGKGKNAKKAGKEAKETAAAAVEEASSSTDASAPAEAKKAFEYVCHSHRYSDLYKYIVIPRFFVDGRQYTGKTVIDETSASRAEILSELRAMHPWTGLSPEHFTPKLPTTNFAPKDTLQLYEAMAKVASAVTSAPPTLTVSKTLSAASVTALGELKPETAFDVSAVIDQRMVRNYEPKIQALFQSWCVEYPEVASAILKELTGDIYEQIEEATVAAAPLAKDMGSERFLTESLPTLIDTLREQQWLPAIAFNFDPEMCERLATSLNKALIDKEASFKQSAEYRNARLKYSEEMKEYEAEQKRRERASKKKKDKRNDEDADKEGDPTMEMPVDPDYELAEGTTFTRDGEVVPIDDLKAEASRLKDRGVDGPLVDALRRGIGVHHAALDHKYRQAVELHFRTGQLKIVFATETLALGINMPCRTTIFCGDSPHLTPLQFRQMSGRAGRRGYDPLGRVIFWGIPMHRITYLEGAPLAPIRGNFPLSTSFNLRALVLSTADVSGKKKKKQQQIEDTATDAVHPGAKKAAAAKAKKAAAKKAAPEPAKVKASWDDSDDSEEEDDEPVFKKKTTKASWDDSSDSEDEKSEPEEVDEVMAGHDMLPLQTGCTEIFKSVEHVYTNSLFLYQHPEMKSQLDIHTQCSLQYMAKLGLVTPLGKPIDLAGITCHLSWAEPGNLVLARFLSTPIIQQICDSPTPIEDRVLSLLNLTAHLFGRIHVPPYAEENFKQQLAVRVDQPKHSTIHSCTHALFLPPLPKEQQEVIDQHNKEVLEILNAVILPYAKTTKPFAASSNTEKWMPCSSLKHLSSASEQPSGGLFQKLADSKMDVVARSPIAALGGHGDMFQTQADMRTMRNGLAAVDFGLLVNEDATGRTLPLNAYLYDLFTASNYDWLKKHNMLSDADLWEGCHSYLENLKAIRAAMVARVPETEYKTNNVLRVFSKLYKEFDIKYRAVFKWKIRQQVYWITVRGVEGYNGDLQKHILSKTRISVLRVKKVPTVKNRSYVFKIPCRNESDRSRVIELFSSWSNPEWWIDNEDSDAEDDDLD